MSVHVLILTDQVTTQSSLAAVVQSGGARVLVADSLPAAMDALRVDWCPLIFASELRKGPGGSEICSTIRATLGGRDARIVALTRDDARLPEQLATEGFDDVVRWPIESGRALMLVRSAIRSGAREQSIADLLRRLAFDLAWS